MTDAVGSLEVTFRGSLYLYGYQQRPTFGYQIVLDRPTAVGHPIGA